jgi:hypothetical protein
MICILTPFAVTWSATIDLIESFDNTTTINNDLLLSTTNLSFTQNHINQVKFRKYSRFNIFFFSSYSLDDFSTHAFNEYDFIIDKSCCIRIMSSF